MDIYCEMLTEGMAILFVLPDGLPVISATIKRVRFINSYPQETELEGEHIVDMIPPPKGKSRLCK